MSNYFPKYSPDGKWIVFCKAKSFMLLQPDSELNILPASGGEARRLRANTARLNSWHSWSPNGKWLVFASKVNGPYTQLLLTHVDPQGESTPPVVLENFTSPGFAANIPEFVNASPTAIKGIRQDFLDDVSFERAGNQFLKDGDVDNAAEAYRTALKLNPQNADVHVNLGVIALRKGNLDEAKASFITAIQLKPQDANATRNLGDVLVRQGKPEEAMACYRRALTIEPKYTDVRINLATLLSRSGKGEEALAELVQAVQHEPDSAVAHFHLGRAWTRKFQLAKAIDSYHRALELNPELVDALVDLAIIRAESPFPEFRDGAEALKAATEACKLTHDQAPKAMDALAAAYAESGQFPEAVRAGRRAQELARKAGDIELTGQIEARTRLYQSGRRPPLSTPAKP